MANKPASSSANDWRKEAAETYKEKSASKTFKLGVGENTVRILPRKRKSKDESAAPFFRFMQHSNVGKDKRFLMCGKDIKGEGKCWLCDKAEKLAGSDNSKHQAVAAAIAAKEQFVLQVAYLDTDVNKLRGPVLWRVPCSGKTSVAVTLLAYLKNPKVELVDLKKGRAITISRTGTDRNNTRYGPYVIDEDATPISDQMAVRIKPFTDLVDGYSAKAQEAAYFGREEDEVEEPETTEEETTEEVEETVEEETTEEVEETVEEETIEEEPVEEEPVEEEEVVEEEVIEDEPEPPVKPKGKPAAKPAAKAPPAKPKGKPKPPVEDDEDIPF